MSLSQSPTLHSHQFTTKIGVVNKLKALKVFSFKINLILSLILILLAFLVGTFISKIPPKTAVLETAVNQSHQAEDLTVRVNQAHLTDVIRVTQKGTPAPAGKDFLVVFTEVENASSSGKQLVYGNWFRLEEKTGIEAAKKLAPLPINAQFTIPPQASLEKQIVFIVDEGIKNFNLLVGDIEKPQKSIPIGF